MIPFNKPPYVGTELAYVREAVEANRKISGDGPFTQKATAWLEEQTGSQKVLLTTSGTTALEMAALLCNLSAGDEVILPSYTFSTTATAFVAVGARLVFVDIRPDTMNIDEKKIEAAITDKTKVIAVVHYAGVSCEMDAIMDIAERHGLLVVEDAAQGVLSSYKGRPLGTIGDFGCYSFHETKNYSMGEGGALLIRDSEYNEQAEIIREKGTNRSNFLRGEVDKYTWVSYGSSCLPSDMCAAYLYGQLLEAKRVYDDRMKSWTAYYRSFCPLQERGLVQLPVVPEGCVQNAHMFYLKCASLEQRDVLISFLKDKGVHAVFHYVPLHSSPAGMKYGRFDGVDAHTTAASDCLVRLPLFFGMTDDEVSSVISAVLDFFDRA
ncbi:dTDP-4-amino-4,6-dideoxygalactose transaminase [Gordonibacter sp. An232A]|nr:dTDP-4-amino-4,6-dideoxygalactose transaminase [Gordonibacter sp. An232A]